MNDIVVDRCDQVSRRRFPQADDPLPAQGPGRSKEGSAVGEEVGKTKTDGLNLLAEGLAMEQGWPRRCDRRGGQQGEDKFEEGYRWIARLMLET